MRSAGGFAHVYLVRTPQPIFGTTHHVLKRIAVANAAMLEEVKKEVDIMVSYTLLYICFTIG
jgi:AP2-associated kinase